MPFHFSNAFGGGHYYDELRAGEESEAAGQKAAEVGDVRRIKVVVRPVKAPCSVSKLILMPCNVTLELHDGYVFFHSFTFLPGSQTLRLLQQ